LSVFFFFLLCVPFSVFFFCRLWIFPPFLFLPFLPVERLEKNGAWYWVRMHAGGQEGYIPANYVDVKGPAPGSGGAPSPSPGPPGQGPPSAPGRSASGGGATWARAVFSFSAQQPGDLTFGKGDLILLTQHNKNWWAGVVNGSGRPGFFPRFVVSSLLFSSLLRCSSFPPFFLSFADLLPFLPFSLLPPLRSNYVQKL
jgi:SH3 domain